MRQRFAAWAVTGPPGHLASAAADWAALLWLLARRRAHHGQDVP